ncbi:MAG: hypothetical protein J6S97_00970 [Bacteroidales bacterium]|nr:hypothetical protein [Bacteroidales bacterium]
MKRLVSKFILAGFVIAGLTSCFKDLEPTPLGPDGRQKLSDDQVFWNVVGKLVGMDQMTPDYEGKTFTPTIGSPDNGDGSVRIVGVNSLKAAVDRYNALTGADIDVNTSSYTWNNPAIGSLIWNKGDGNTAWGTVDVSIPAVPGLQKIIYRSPEQGDVNGSVGDNGSAYYRFGDVISRTRPADKKGDVEFPAITEYWVCVRPAFGPEGKGDSHWVSLSPLPRENVWPYYDDEYNYGPYPGSNGNGYGCPYNLGDDLEWLQDFNEMLYAICTAGEDPRNFGNWYTNANNYYHEGWFGADGLLIFNDFTKENLQYHNDFFWQNVKNGWKAFDIFTKLLGTEADGTRHTEDWVTLRVRNGGEGLKYLHTGYSWWTWFSNELDVYQASYKSKITDDHVELNMHSVEKKTVTKQVTNPNNKTDAATNIPFNVKTECSPERPFVINEKFFGDKEPRFIYRYATGQQLAKMGGGTWHAQFALQGFQEVYRYYGNGGFEPNHILTMPPEITQQVSDPDIEDETTKYRNGRGWLYPGCIVKDEEGSHWLCYYGWYDGSEIFGEDDHYARLVSFDNITYRTLDSGNKVVSNDDLMPDLEVGVAGVALAALFNSDARANPGYGQKFHYIREQLKNLCHFDPDSHIVVRDSSKVVGDDTHNGWVAALSMVCEYTLSDVKQGYMRVVLEDVDADGHVNKWLYIDYNNEDAKYVRGPLDLGDLFTSGYTITDEKYVKADKWSLCKRHDTSQRDGNFTKADLYGNTLDMNLFVKNPAQYRSAYHEPVIVPRFMLVDDPWTSKAPQTDTRGRKFSVVYAPEADELDDEDIRTYMSYLVNCVDATTPNSTFLGNDPVPLREIGIRLEY